MIICVDHENCVHFVVKDDQPDADNDADNDADVLVTLTARGAYVDPDYGPIGHSDLADMIQEYVQQAPAITTVIIPDDAAAFFAGYLAGYVVGALEEALRGISLVDEDGEAVERHVVVVTQTEARRRLSLALGLRPPQVLPKRIRRLYAKHFGRGPENAAESFAHALAALCAMVEGV